MAINNANHSGNTQDDYNKIQNNYPYAKLVEEADYVLTETETENEFDLTKKPESETATKVSDVWGFIQDKDKVLIVRASGRYDRFNFDSAAV